MKKTSATTAIETVKSSTAKLGDAVKSNPRTVIYIGLGAVGIYLAYKLIKNTTEAADGLLDDFKNDPNAGGGNFDGTDQSEIKDGATITKVQAQTAASILLEAMGTVGGVNRKEFERIKNIFRGRNIQDYVLFSNAFGEPYRSIITGEVSRWYLGGTKMNLSQWLAKELDDAQINELSTVIPGVFLTN